MLKIKKLEFSEYVGNHASSSFTVGRVFGTNQIRYYIYKEADNYRADNLLLMKMHKSADLPK